MPSVDIIWQSWSLLKICMKDTLWLEYERGGVAPEKTPFLNSVKGHSIYAALLREWTIFGRRRSWSLLKSMVGVAPEKLRQFRQGSLNLRRLLMDSDEEEQYLTTVTTDFDNLVLHPLGIPLSSSPYLPKKGLILHDYEQDDQVDDIVLDEARSRNNLVLGVVVRPPETARGHRVRAYTFTSILLYMQNLVKHAYTAARKVSPSRVRLPEDDMLDVVVPAAAGSFQFILEAASGPDLFGSNYLEDALQQIDKLFEYTTEPEELINHMRTIRGHFPGSYIRLLRLLVEKDTGLQYSWANAKSERSRRYGVSRANAGSLVNALSTVRNLGTESVIVEGQFDRFDRESRNWALLTDKGRRSGKIREEELSLDGLAVGVNYRFHCEEVIDSIESTGRESRTLYLNRFESV